MSTSTKQKVILSALRRQIVCGRLSPGSRMPTHTKLKRMYKASPGTVQSALTRLQSDGFVCARGRLGTFVEMHPPHLSRYALIFHQHPSESRFMLGLWKVAGEFNQTGSRRIEMFENIANDRGAEAFARLVSEVKAHRLAGLMFAQPPSDSIWRPLLDDPKLPRVGFMSPAVNLHTAAVGLDGRAYFDKAFGYFASRGRKRLAIIAAANFVGTAGSLIEEIAGAHGLEVRPYWKQTPDLRYRYAVEACVQLLIPADRTDRPDALLIADDHLVEHATAGLAASGIRAPQDIDIVAHCNFPWPPPSSLPVKWIGIDARQILDTCIRSIDEQRLGKKQPAITHVPVVFEEERQPSFVVG